MGFEVRVQRLEHHALARRDLAQPSEFVGVQGASVGVGQQSGLVANHFAHSNEVVNGGFVAVVSQPFLRDWVTKFRSLTQGE